MIFCVDKPPGITSNQAVQIVKRGGNFKKVGHAGTLDPAASGVLVIGTDESTKELSSLLLEDKEYEAVIRLGVLTDTYDATGFVQVYAPTAPDFNEVDNALDRFPMKYEQKPPVFSALKIKGQRAYDLARSGQKVDLQARTAEFLDKELIEYQNGFVKVRLVVKKGFYVRSFAVDFAAALGTYGVLVSLRRTRSGAFALKQAKSLSEFGFDEKIRSVDEGFNINAYRDLLAACQIELANRWSKESYSLGGIVERGVQKARELGYPTANIAHDEEHCLAGAGVYASHTLYDGLVFRSLTFIGFGNAEMSEGHKFESHLFNFDGNLYGRTIESRLIRFIRKNRKFESLAELILQIGKDAGEAKGI